MSHHCERLAGLVRRLLPANVDQVPVAGWLLVSYGVELLLMVTVH